MPGVVNGHQPIWSTHRDHIAVGTLSVVEASPAPRGEPIPSNGPRLPGSLVPGELLDPPSVDVGTFTHSMQPRIEGGAVRRFRLYDQPDARLFVDIHHLPSMTGRPATLPPTRGEVGRHGWVGEVRLGRWFESRFDGCSWDGSDGGPVTMASWPVIGGSVTVEVRETTASLGAVDLYSVTLTVDRVITRNHAGDLFDLGRFHVRNDHYPVETEPTMR